MISVDETKVSGVLGYFGAFLRTYQLSDIRIGQTDRLKTE